MTTRPQRAARVLVVCVPDLAGPPPDPAGPGPAAAFERVAAVIAGFAPRLEVIGPGVCAVSARGPARYFGGEEALAAKIVAAVAACGLHARAGVADSLFAARLAAQSGPSGRLVPPGQTRAFLAPYPVSVLARPDLGGPDLPELAGLLPRLGIRTLGEFAALPAAEAAGRFGLAGALAHRLARGASPRPLSPRAPAADLSVAQEFDPPAAQAEPVIFAAKALAQRLHAGLAAAGQVCVRVQVEVLSADGHRSVRRWRHDGLLSDTAVAERVRWQLASWSGSGLPPDSSGSGQPAGLASPAGHSRPAGGSGPADHFGRAGAGPTGRAGADRTGAGRTGDQGGSPGEVLAGGIAGLRLVPDQLVADTGQQLGLWGEAVISDQLARAAIRVQAMLGHGAVVRPVLSGGRSPGDQVTLVPFGDVLAPGRPVDRPWPGRIPVPAPATVYPDPGQAVVTDDQGDPVTVTGRALVSGAPAWLHAPGGPPLAVIAWAGPWPLTERWWDPAAARRLARFQLVTEDGSAWLAVVHEGRWRLEASYD